jgi:uncharacterized membrane protein
MHEPLNTILNLVFRWAHVVAGIVWIGLLYFFNWVNSPFQATIDGPTKKAVNPELLPRALFWFRWGAAWTWITGILLAGLIYYQGHQAFDGDYQTTQNPWLWLAVFFIILALGFVLYNLIMKSIANKVVGAAISLVIFAGVYLFLEYVGHYGGRSLYIHAGAILGTMMAGNVWMIIWPYQQRIIRAVKEGTAPDPAEVAAAGLRSRHNTFMSVPLVFLMISNHYPNAYGQSPMLRDGILAVMIAVGFIVTKMIYGKAPKVAGF